MKALELFNRLNINYLTEGHKHCAPGWAHMVCPFCTGNPGMHLGFHLDNEFFRCWRCGWHPILETLHKLSGISYPALKDLLNVYGGKSRQKVSSKETVRMKAFQYPTGIVSLAERHRQYLQYRRFNPDKIIHNWSVQSSPLISNLDGADYGNRIIIPIYWDGQLVSFQGRTPTKKDPKYKTCPKDRELIHHKHILYAHPDIDWNQTGIVVEGVTDVWRFGKQAIATFGIEYKLEQVKVLAERFRKLVICFDDDPQAVKQAKKLTAELRMRGVKTSRISIVGDPGDMDQEEADELIKEIMNE